MSPITISEEPNVTVRDLLAAQWAAANTGGITPEFSTGWWKESATRPLLTMPASQADDSPIGGGETGYTAIDAGGGGGVQYRGGIVVVTAWAHFDMDLGTADDPRTWLWDAVKEIRRIMNSRSTGYQDFDTLGVSSVAGDVESDQAPTLFKRIATVDYTWLSRP